MFDFRIITCADGVDVIDKDLKTPYESLTASEMEDYIEMDRQLVYMEKLKEKRYRAAERKRKMKRNFLYRLACLCGLV